MIRSSSTVIAVAVCVVCAISLAGEPSDAPTDQDRADDATALLRAKIAASTQPALISVRDLAELHSQLGMSQAENAKLITENANLSAQIVELQKATASVTAESDVPQAQAQAQTVPQPPAPPTPKPLMVRAGQTIGRFGDVELKLLGYGVGNIDLPKLKLLGFGAGKNALQYELFYLQLGITNVNPTRKFDYQTWRGSGFSFSNDDVASATDNFGNDLKRMPFDSISKSVESVYYSESLYPKKSVNDVLVFERPIDGTTSIKIKLPRGNIKAEGDPIDIALPMLSTSPAENANLQAEMTKFMAQLAPAPTPTTVPATPTTAGDDGAANTPTPKPLIVRAGQTIGRFGDVELKLVDYGVGKIVFSNFFGLSGESPDQFFHVQLSITNVNPNRKFDYQTWRGSGFSFSKDDVASATDNFGNDLKSSDVGLWNTIVGSVDSSESLYPNKSVNDVLIFERPIDGTTSIKIELPRENIKAEGKPIVIELPMKPR